MKPTKNDGKSRAESGLTQQLALAACSLKYDDLPGRVRQLARQCVLDWIGVTLAGAQEGVVQHLLAEARGDGGAPIATIYGHGLKLPAMAAALINGAAGHALDFDDVNMAMPGHPTVAVLPGLLALAEERKASGRAVIEAFVAGYELACRVGAALAPAHYNVMGFHATATVGSLGAAAAAARLLGLDAERTAVALAIAATQANGLKSLFGTDCKPFHAGKAAENGLRAARLAARGFSARNDILECPQGFGAAMSPSFNPENALAPPGGGAAFHIERNLFKYHAACYLTHATIDACREIVATNALRPDAIKSITLRLDESCGRVCNIPAPQTGLEAKFSLRQTAAMAVAGVDTAAISSYSEASARDPALVRLRDKVEIDFVNGWQQTRTAAAIETTDGRKLSAENDSGIPGADLAEQGRRLHAKFMALVGPIVGAGRAEEMAAAVTRLDDMADIGNLARLCGGAV